MSIFRKEYRENTEQEKADIEAVKDKAQELYDLIDKYHNPDTGREAAIAKTKLEESVMWAVKGITK